MSTRTPRTITLEEIKTAARSYYEAGKLGFQNGMSSCELDYGDGKGTRCAIGAALTPEEIAYVDAKHIDTTVGRLCSADVLAMDDDTLDAAAAIQCCHDSMCCEDINRPGAREAQEPRFRALLDLPPLAPPETTPAA